MKKTFFFIAVLFSVVTLLSSCGGNNMAVPSTAPAVTTGLPSPFATRPVTTLPPISATFSPAAKDFLYASAMADFFYNINAVQNYYGSGLTALSAFKLGSGIITAANPGYRVMLVDSSGGPGVMPAIPPEMTEDLPADGAMAAPPGACPAAAEPYERFITIGGEVVSPALLSDKDVATLPVSMINAPLTDPGSLLSVMQQLVPVNDRRLVSANGWNTLLWNKLKAMQVPAKSLMDYQMWTLSGDIEAEVVSAFRRSLADQGVPDIVLDAFDQSDYTGWFAKLPPTPEDALAQMDIRAKLTGSVSGMVHEWRDFSIPYLGSSPVFGDQHGDGTVFCDIPEIGPVESSVDILFDQYDELGRAINGTVTATPLSVEGYKVIFEYKPDGSKEGRIIDVNTGEIMGYLSMTIDAERFTNYISVKTESYLEIPSPTPETTLFQ